MKRLANPKGFFYDPSLVLYLPLYKLDGASFMSKDAYGHLCTATGAPWGIQGRAFDGDDKIDCGDKAQFSFEHNTPFSILMWFKPSDTTAWSSLVTKITVANVFRGYAFLQTNAGKLTASIINTNVIARKRIVVDSDAAITQDVFQLVGFTYDGGGASAGVIIYRNDAVFASTSSEDTLGGLTIDNTVSLLIGDREEGDIPANGTFGEVWVYNRVVSLIEVQNIYLATKWRYR